MRRAIETVVACAFLLVRQAVPCHAASHEGVLEQIELGGVDQWILTHGNHPENPVLLVLHGGPGYAMMPLLHDYNVELEEHFTVVNWDQRGAGKSYSPDIPEESMTLEQFVSDARELTELLQSRHDKEKIYLLGHSFGTVLGMLLIDRYPEHYWGFVGVGQVVDVIENEQLSYDFALSQATAAGNQEAIDQLREVGRPDDDGQYRDASGYEVTMEWVGYYGGDVYGETSTAEIEAAILSSEVYAEDQEKVQMGWEFSQTLFSDEDLWYLDFRELITRVDVPVFFFMGRHDYDTPYALVEEYFALLEAPVKELIWFEEVAHFPFYEDPAGFNAAMIDVVLARTQDVTTVVEGQRVSLPGRPGLNQNFPNPFNRETVIRFSLPTGADVELAVLNLAGQRVATLVEGVREAGVHAVKWDGRDNRHQPLASGIYLYRLRTGRHAVETRKLVLVR